MRLGYVRFSGSAVIAVPYFNEAEAHAPRILLFFI